MCTDAKMWQQERREYMPRARKRQVNKAILMLQDLLFYWSERERDT